MPYMKIETDSGFEVRKQDGNGDPVGDVLGAHESAESADEQTAALYAAESEDTEAVTEATEDGATDEITSEQEDEPSTLPDEDEEPQTVAETTKSKIVLREYSEYTLEGAFPKVMTDSRINQQELLEFDPKPLFLTLPIAETGRVSQNGLVYDEALVSAIEQQLVGNGGIRGHIADEDLSTAWPIPDVYWVGTLREGNTLWAKGYVPPGETRQDIQLKRITKGKIGTSIFAHVVQEMDAEHEGRWYARDIELEQVDFASPQRAALRMSGDFQLTREMTDTANVHEDNPMTITLKDISQELKDQVLAEFREKNRVTEMQTELDRAKKTIKEMGDVTAHVKLNIPDGADPMERIQALTEFLAALQSQFGEDVSVEMLTNMKQEAEALQTEVEAMDEEQYAAQVDAAVMELTQDWRVSTNDGKAKLAELHKNIKKLVAFEMIGKGRDRAAMKAAIQKVWDDDVKAMAEMTRDQISGGTILPMTGTHRTRQGLATPDEIRAARERTGI